MKGLQEILSSKGIKPTYQRLKVLKYLQAAGSHPTADNIYRVLVKDMPTMSKTTVYNTLKTFSDKGIIAAISITGTEVRYEFCAGQHHHFLCEQCHRIIDVQVMCPNMARGEIDGNIIRELHGYFKGLCADCAKKNKRRQ